MWSSSDECYDETKETKLNDNNFRSSRSIVLCKQNVVKNFIFAKFAEKTSAGVHF